MSTRRGSGSPREFRAFACAKPPQKQRADRFSAPVELEHRQGRPVHGRRRAVGGHRTFLQRTSGRGGIQLSDRKIDEADEHRPGQVQVVGRKVDHRVGKPQQSDLRRAEQGVEAVRIRIAVQRDRRGPDDEQCDDQVGNARRRRANVIVMLEVIDGSRQNFHARKLPRHRSRLDVEQARRRGTEDHDLAGEFVFRRAGSLRCMAWNASPKDA